MTISQELINSLSSEQQPRFSKLRTVHLMKSDLTKIPSLSLDGKTFNSKKYVVAKYETTDNIEHRFKFAGISAGYKLNKDGNMSVAIIFANPNDNFSKKIGRSLLQTRMDEYQSKHNQYGYMQVDPMHNAFYITLNFEELIETTNLSDLFPYSFLSGLSFSVINSSVVSNIVLNIVTDTIQKLTVGSGVMMYSKV